MRPDADTATGTGRTIWDVVHSMLSARATFISLAMAVLIAVPSLWYVAHTQAEPGTEIFLLGGLIKYQKAKLREKPDGTPFPDSAVQLEQLKTLATRLDSAEKNRAALEAARGALAAKLDKLSGDLRDRDKQLQERQNTPALPAPPVPYVRSFMFKWQLSDDKCKVKATEAIKETGGTDINIEKLAATGSKNRNNITILCNSPYYVIIVAGPDTDAARDLRDAIVAAMDVK